MRLRRFATIVLVAALVPGTFWRSDVKPIDPSLPVSFEQVSGPHASNGPLSVTGVWSVTSRHRMDGGYSALEIDGEGGLLAASDAGGLLRISDAGTEQMAGRFASLASEGELDKRGADIEAMTRDPETGQYWIAYERSNAVERYSTELEAEARHRPQAIRHWRANSGSESFLRLSDGRFLAIGEVATPRDSGRHEAVLFDSDPSEGAGVKALVFTLIITGGKRPVDAAQLPDGRILILLRSLDSMFPPRFANALAFLDPDQIEEGATVSLGRQFALPEALPTENYEGMAVEEMARGKTRLWLISDNNFSSLQRSLLVALDYRLHQRKKARGSPARP